MFNETVKMSCTWRGAEESAGAGSWGGDSMYTGLAYQINPTNLKQRKFAPPNPCEHVNR